MILNLNVKSTKKYDCMQGVIANCAEYKLLDHYMISLGRWDFDYLRTRSDALGDCICPYSQRDVDGGWLFHGFKFGEKCYGGGGDIVRNSLTELLDCNEPIVIQSNLFHCPWSLAFEKYHFFHYYMIIGYEKNSDTVTCVDPYISDEAKEYSLDELMRSIYKVQYLQTEENTKERKDYLLELKKDVEYFKKQNVVGRLLAFAEDVGKYDGIVAEIKQYQRDLYACPLLDAIKILSTNRRGYFYLLEELNNRQIIEIHSLELYTEKIMATWERIRILFMKIAYLKNAESQIIKIEQVIKECAKLEREFFCVLENAIDGKEELWKNIQ